LLGMLRVVAIILIFGSAIFWSPAPAKSAELAGKVTRIRGEAVATGSPSRKLELNSEVWVKDVITTGADARLLIRFHDGSQVTLGEKTTFSVNQFHHEEGGESLFAAFTLAEGAFHAITGSLVKNRARSVFEVKTPLAVIGARGTQFWGGQKADFLEVVLLEGTAIYIENETGRVEIGSAGIGTDVKPGEGPTAAKAWGQPRLNRAIATVSWE